MLKITYALIWQVCHLLVNIYELFCWFFLRLHALKLWSYDHFRIRASIVNSNDRSFLKRCKKELSKLPRHLSIIIAPDDRHINDEVLIRIFKYALFMDIECVSVYDTRLPGKGYIMLDKLKTPEGIYSEILHDNHWSMKWSMKCDATSTNGIRKAATVNGYANGGPNGAMPTKEKCQQISSFKQLQIHKISASDGHPLIAEVCRELFKARQAEDVQLLLKDRTLLSAHINAELSKRLGFISDPELCIVFSRQICTYGMLPWHIRFTEFHRLDPERYFNSETFAKVLYRYSRCEQRWGK